MEPEELADELKVMYKDGLQKDEGVAHIILFGIKYAEELAGYSPRDIIELSGIKKCRNLKENTYIPEIKNGMKLAQYVELKQ